MEKLTEQYFHTLSGMMDGSRGTHFDLNCALNSQSKEQVVIVFVNFFKKRIFL